MVGYHKYISKIAARLDPDFVRLCREMQRLAFDIAKKRKIMTFSTIFCPILSTICGHCTFCLPMNLPL